MKRNSKIRSAKYSGSKTVLLLLLVLLLLPCACKKFIEVPLPGTETYPKDIYDSDVTANSAIIAIYAEMIGNANKGLASGNTRSVSFLAALSADELENYSHLNLLREFYLNEISSANTANEKGLWTEAYRYIYAANAVLEGLQQSGSLSPALKTQLEGEALFIRAFVYFYLVNLYGDVPLALTTDYKVNGSLLRSPDTKVYEQIGNDLRNAIDKLSENYPGIEKIRPNKWAAVALLARVQLYTGNWPAAESLAGKLIAEGGYSLDSLDAVFLSNSKEAIWQLRPNTPGLNTWEGRIFLLSGMPGSAETNAATLSKHLLNSFEPGDARRTHWVDSIQVAGENYYFPYKYKVGIGTELKEYSMVLRLAEVYLVRAEARVHTGNIAAARADLNSIRQRAGLPVSNANTATALLQALAHERQLELFTEWGHRWLDLKRTKTATAQLQNSKGPGWKPSDTLYPIPLSEISVNPHLSQNEGY